MNWSSFFDVVSVGSVVGTLAFGIVLGATYGWRSGGGALALLIVGSGFVLVQAFAIPAPIERYLGRLVLWTLLCGVLGIGRQLRLQGEERRLARRIRRVRRDGAS